MSLTRRGFLQGTSALAALSAASPRLAFATDSTASSRGTVVLIFQRGGMDGLNVVVPHADSDYYRLRPGIGIPRPGATGGAIDLDGFFGMNPALAPLLPLYQSGELAFVHATGYRHDSRSHFECQDHIERGTLHLTGDMKTPRCITLATGSAQKPVLESALASLYDANTLFAATSVQALDAVDELAGEQPSQYPVEGGASYPTGRFGSQLRELAQIIKAGMGLEVACVDIGGWDHHAAIGQALPPGPARVSQRPRFAHGRGHRRHPDRIRAARLPERVRRHRPWQRLWQHRTRRRREWRPCLRRMARSAGCRPVQW